MIVRHTIKEQKILDMTSQFRTRLDDLKKTEFQFAWVLIFLAFTQHCSGQDVEALLGPGVTTESAITSGQVRIRETVHNYSTMPAILTIKDPRTRATEMEYDQKKAQIVTSVLTMTFDNDKKELITTSESSTKIDQRGYFSEHLRKGWSSQPRTGRDYKLAHVQPALWPPFWPYVLWQSRSLTVKHAAVKAGKLVLRGADAHDSSHAFAFIGKHASGVDWLIKADLRTGGLMSHIDQYDRVSGRLDSTTDIAYKTYPGNLVYPDSTKETRFVYDKAGKQFVDAEVQSQVIDAKLNIGLSDKDLDFGPIPLGARVYDTRFGKEIVYEQGEKQMSDRDMFEVAKNPYLLSTMTAPPRSRAYPPIYQIAVMILAPLLVVLILVRYRSKFRRP